VEQDDITHRCTLVFEKAHTLGFQIPKANSITKNVTVTKCCGAKTASNDSSHREIE